MLSLGLSVVTVGLIVWWFFGKRQAAVAMATQSGGVQQIEIVVDGGYSPQVVQLKAGVPAKLIFDRQDPSSCLEEVSLPDFGITQKLALGQKTTVELKAQVAGTYKYTCGMHMFSGQVVVK
ncbi:MAG TPA: cupredoxin domain-containing protein [Candidatus Saccharimonadia bacterium]|nr:cupredoxin domain-containing protein [Candidatus Saccharimonadia bacterium]